MLLFKFLLTGSNAVWEIFRVAKSYLSLYGLLEVLEVLATTRQEWGQVGCLSDIGSGSGQPGVLGGAGGDTIQVLPYICEVR